MQIIFPRDTYYFNELSFGMHDAIPLATAFNRKEGDIMKNTLSRKSAYLGAGAGIVLFAIFGLLPGSLLGGAAGIKIAGELFGLPLEANLVARSIVLLSMLLGVTVAGIAIVTAASTMGWLTGRFMDSAVAFSMNLAQERTNVRHR